MSYKYLTIKEREMLMFLRAKGLSIRAVALRLGQNPSTISRELKRCVGNYSPSKAENDYHQKRHIRGSSQQAALDTTLMFRPDQIVFGGGVVSEDFLKKVRREFKKLLNNYVDVGNVDEYITMPLAQHNGSATIGDFALALKAATN